MSHARLPKASFVIDKEHPTASITSLHDHIQKQLTDLDKRMSDCIDRYGLNKPHEELFAGYTPVALEEVVAHIQTLFTRCDMMLRVYECELKWMAEELQLDKMPFYVRDRHHQLKDDCRLLRRAYVDRVGSNVIRAFRRCLLTANQIPLPPAKGEDLNRLLVRYFGEAIISPDDIDHDPAAQEMFQLLRDIGNMTGHTSAMDTVIQTLKASVL